jgi:alanyl-tRNA synthetase
MKITAQELRDKYLDFFKSKGHHIIPSASLVPESGSSALFTMAGMFPLIPYLLGDPHPGGKRVANVQKCIRTVDIDNVGDDTHLTFIEMLGNWSFGDYFKQEAISWSYEFLTSQKWLNLPKERLAFSVFAGDSDAPRDEESAAIWLSLGISKERIAYLPKEDNWWIAGDSGPCGPDTEMFYWLDDGVPAPANFQASKNDKRWVEIWNDVFMQYEKQPDGTLIPLKKPNVDTGMGLDRMLAVLNGQTSVYDTEIFDPMFQVLELDQEILTNDEVRKARIVLDHVLASVFIVSDNVLPSNKDRGYVLRRLLRRSLVMGRLLNLKHHWLEALIGKVVATYSEAYPELVENSEKTFEVILTEQKKFEGTLEKGLKEFEKKLSAGPKESSKSAGGAAGLEFTGKDAFDLYQTYGFPWELTKELAEQSGQNIDKDQFEAEFKKHQELSRTSSAGMFKGGLVDHEPKTIRHHTAHHLLLAALRQVLGDHVLQRGSNVSSERLRLDFSHPDKLSVEQLKTVEQIVNQKISEDLEVRHEEMPKIEAEKLGAMAEFGAKYGDVVSVYTIFNKDGSVFSREFCGGPHVEHTGVIGSFKILKEEASSAGIRRIKAAAA